MGNPLEQFFDSIKTSFNQGMAALNQKNKAQEEVQQEKRVHVQLVDQLTYMSSIINHCPGVIQKCEKARFIVNAAPLGSPPAGQKILIEALKALDSVKETEPQLRRPLKRLRPLVQQYLKLEDDL